MTHDDAAWIARQKRRENPPDPREITGPQLREYAQDYNAAELEHHEAQAALTQASDRAIEASARRAMAKENYIRAARDYAATLERKRANNG